MEDFKSKIQNSTNLDELDKIRVELFGKKGLITAEFARLKEIAPQEKKEFARNLNTMRDDFNALIAQRKDELEKANLKENMKKEACDVTMFGERTNKGALHPVMETMDRIIEYFLAQNFSIEDGPLIEDDFHNFEALNLPKFHPARDMQDTFYLNNSNLLRTHTSGVQIRTMEKFKEPPIRMIAPGAVFRRDMDLTHTPMFHQVEGLVVERGDGVSFVNLKYILEDFLRYMFGDVKVRVRPSFFPFTEPSTEVDISCIFCHGSGCRVCKQTGWLEVLGAGVVDPNVFKAVKWKNVSGYAFGLGVERFAMLLHEIPDLRSLFEGDLRLLEQFK